MTNNTLNIDQICQVLDIKPVTKRILLSLIEKGNMTVADISSHLKIPKSTIYDSLQELMYKSTLIESLDGRAKSFGIPNLSHSEEIYKKQINKLDNARKSLIS